MSADRRLPGAVAALLLLPLVSAACAEGGQREAAAAEGAFDARMAEEHEGDRPVPSGAAREEPARAVEGDTVSYAAVDGRRVTGYLATPASAAAGDSLPGLLVIHEWWGLNDHIRSMARRLAGEGYRALAVDLYYGSAASTPDSARTLASGVVGEEARSNLRQAYRWLAERGSPRVGSIGWCFGGGWSLRTALLFPEELDAAVIYYGRLVTEPGRLSGLETPVLGHFGAEDGSIPVADVRRFEAVLDSLGGTVETHVYEGAGHAFANPSGTRYDRDAAEKAWSRTVRFLGEHLMP